MFGKIIDEVRREKGLSINFLCQDITSRSTYFRYINAECDIHSETLVKLVNKLNLSFTELIYRYNQYKLDVFYRFLKYLDEIKLDNSKLQKVKNETHKYITYEHDVHHHIELVCNVYMSYNIGCIDKISIEALKNYFFSVDTFSYYELSLYGVIYQFLGVSYNKALYKNVLKHAKDYDNLDSHVHSSALLSCHLVCYFLEHGELKTAKLLYDSVNNQIISEKYVATKLFIKFLSIIVSTIFYDENGDDDFKQLLSICDFINLPVLKQFFERKYREILKNFRNVTKTE